MKNSPTSFLLLIAIISLTGIFAFMHIYAIQAILPDLIKDLSASEVQLGMAVGATILGISLMSPFMGIISDRFGRKIFIVGSLVLLAVPTGLIALISDMQYLILLRFLQGIAITGITVVLVAYLGEEFDQQYTAQLMAYYVAASVLGGFLGRFLLGHLAAVFTWRIGFLILSLLTLFSGLFAFFALPKSRQFVRKNHQNIGKALLNHLKNRYLLISCSVGGCVLFTLVATFTYINLHLSAYPYQLTSGQLGNLFALYLIGMVITPFAGSLSKRYGSNWAVIIGLSMAFLGILLSLSDNLWLIITALVLVSSGVFIMQASMIGYLATNINHNRSLASGLYYMAYYLGGTFGALVGGFFYRHFEWIGVVGIILLVQFFEFLIILFFMFEKSKSCIKK